MLLLMLLACTPNDGADWTLEGGWAHVRPPPGHADQECWVWSSRGVLTGPVCFRQGERDELP